MIRMLSRPYACKWGAPVIDRIDDDLFKLIYFEKCMSCTFCHDSCCQYGADIELLRVAKLEEHQKELEAYLGVPRSQWFREDPEDLGYLDEAEYPGGKYTRTQMVDRELGPRCVFAHPTGRGCRIHSFALERGLDVHELKPMVCLLFPFSFNGGCFTVPYEIQDESLVCLGTGNTLYRSARNDLAYYFGDELVQELDQLEQLTLEEQKIVGGSGVISLPLMRG